MGLKDSVCIITGGGSGIGRATGLMMAEEGAVVIAVGRTVSKVEAIRDEIADAGGIAEAYGVDVGEKAGVAAMVDEVLDKYGKVDVLVNNAGHSSPRRMLLTTTPEDLLKRLREQSFGIGVLHTGRGAFDGGCWAGHDNQRLFHGWGQR